jgi:hypothetical protein
MPRSGPLHATITGWVLWIFPEFGRTPQAYIRVLVDHALISLCLVKIEGSRPHTPLGSRPVLDARRILSRCYPVRPFWKPVPVDNAKVCLPEWLLGVS